MKKSRWMLGLRIHAGAVVTILTLCVANANAGVLDHDKLLYQYKDCDKGTSTFAYPLFRNDLNGASARINTYLHMMFLGAAPPVTNATGAMPLATDSWINGGASELEAKATHSNGNRVVTMDFSYSDCGDGRSGTRSFSFDARDGRLLVENELFTREGRTKLQQYLLNARRKLVTAKIGALENRLKKQKKGRNTTNLDAAIEMYERCQTDRFSQTESAPVSSLLITRFDEKAVTFGAASCSSQADAALDEIGPFREKLAVDQVRPYLSSYGLYIFEGSGNGKLEPLSPYAQIFHGRIGKFPVTLYLGVYNPGAHSGDQAQWDEAVYFYDKYRSLIKPSIKQAAGVFVLEERDSTNAVIGRISFTKRDGKLVGEWAGAGKRYAFEAAP